MKAERAGPQLSVKARDFAQDPAREGHVCSDQTFGIAIVEIFRRSPSSFMQPGHPGPFEMRGQPNTTGDGICFAAHDGSAHRFNPVGRHPYIIIGKQNYIAVALGERSVAGKALSLVWL